ncbi:MAG: cadherin domain-containing protein, partial [Thermoanaerobaculia bacterium]|nr:cadherin domain-containing protein [Thermoanaerobaculia bacterium]
PNGSAVGTVTASDPDAGTILTWSIQSGNAGGAFAIGAGGQITVANVAALDFETTPSFTLAVRATDNGAPALFDEESVTVTLTNVNEAPTVTAAAFSIPENSPNGSAVGTVAASDPDAGSAFTWSIQSGNTDGAFAIGAGSGHLTVANPAALDFESAVPFALVVRATDNGAPALFAEGMVTVTVANVEEPVTAVADARSTDEDTPLVEPDPGVAGNDVDPDGLALVVTAFDATSVLGATVSVAPGGGFTYDPRPSAALQALRVGESLSDTFSYTVTDAGATSSAATVTVEVAGVDAGLVLSKEALVDGTVAVGTSFAFRLTVLNEGPGVATGVVVEDPLPPLLV